MLENGGEKCPCGVTFICYGIHGRVRYVVVMHLTAFGCIGVERASGACVGVSVGVGWGVKLCCGVSGCWMEARVVLLPILTFAGAAIAVSYM